MQTATPERQQCATGPDPTALATVRGRRQLFAILVSGSVAAMLGLMVYTLSPGGLDLIDIALVVCFAVTLPWTVIGFWNAVIGLIIMRTTSDATRAIFPQATAVGDDESITRSTALLACIRNEDARTVARNLEVTIQALVDEGVANHFHAYILSDSNWDETVENERLIFERLQQRWEGRFAITYRRRVDNAGYKAGNIRDFCERWGARHDFALVLDADSLMSAKSILRMVRIMQSHPRLGILQSLVVGMPTVSPFARIFQFGMRLGMRSYTLGSAWWQADCGPYWGHNALIRLRPFIHHCDLPVLPGKGPLDGHILSHDQVEAVLMRRAGFEVRVLPEEGGSWEQNPPTLLEHMRRDIRWCHGNMQYWRLLAMPGLEPVSRIQLLLAILMYLGSAAWVTLMALSVLRAGLADDPAQIFRAEAGMVLLATILVMVFAPKIASVADVLSSRDSRRAFGGTLSVLFSTLGEAIFSALLAPVLAIAHTRFLLGLPFGRAAVWSAQCRGTHRVMPREAAARLWPQTLFAAAVVAWLLATAPLALFGFLPFLTGAVLAIPIAVVTSWAGLGLVLAARSGLWQIPDEIAPATELRALRLPALRRARRTLPTIKAAFESGS